MLSDVRDELIRQSRLPALWNHSALFHESIRGHSTWKKSFRARFAKEYIPTFFPSGFPSAPTPLLFVVLSVKQTVNARCIVSAVPSTKVFLFSPASTSATLRSRLVRSGLLSRVIASLASAVDSWMAVGRITSPYVGLVKAARQVLCRIRSALIPTIGDSIHLAREVSCECVSSKSSKLTSLQNSR